MEITYFVISIIEIILTVFLISVIFKADKKICCLINGFKTLFDGFYFNFKKTGIILSSANKILKLYKVYDEETAKFKKFYKTIKNLQHSFLLLTFVLGVKNSKKINLKKLIKLF